MVGDDSAVIIWQDWEFWLTKQQPPVTPWKLGVFDGLVLADKMTGCTGGVAQDATCIFCCGSYKSCVVYCCGALGRRLQLQVMVGYDFAVQNQKARVCHTPIILQHTTSTLPCVICFCAGTPGYVELQGTTAGNKMQQAMSEVGSTPMLALLMAYQPQELPLEQQAAAAAAAAAAGQGEQQQQQQQHAELVLDLPFDAAAVVNSEEIQWICMDSKKPVRAVLA
jgi:hypothetical protein